MLVVGSNLKWHTKCKKNKFSSSHLRARHRVKEVDFVSLNIVENPNIKNSEYEWSTPEDNIVLVNDVFYNSLRKLFRFPMLFLYGD
jgi:hypothetical protein